MGVEWEVVPGRVLSVTEGDITRIAADAIVNAANSRLAGGGGVDGAIHRAGGPAVMDDLKARYGPVGVRGCPAGGAVLSVAGALPATWIIHAVGPVWNGGNAGEPEALASAYGTSMRLADEVEATSITFPAISTGIYGYPPELAAAVAVRTVAAALISAASVRHATMVAYGTDSAWALEDAVRREHTTRGE